MPPDTPDPHRVTAWRSLLIGLKYLGLIGVLGGMASLTAMALIGPRPATIDGWTLLVELMRSIFFPVFFAGVVLAVLSGIGLFLRTPRVWLASRWFRAKAVGLAIALPGLHLFARTRVLAFYDAIETGDLALVILRWNDVGVGFLIGFVILTAFAAWGRFAPRS